MARSDKTVSKKARETRIAQLARELFAETPEQAASNDTAAAAAKPPYMNRSAR
jgi:hypothetical protein